MSYNKLFKLLEDNTRMTSFISNISSGYMEIPYIMSETLKILEDDNPFFGIISDSNKKSLCIMMDQYFTDCWGLFIEDLKLDKCLNYGKIEIYKVAAANGLRYATVNEVAQGIKGLIGEYIYPAGEEEYKKLCLLQWSFTGVSYYFRQAGYKLDYDNNGKVTNSFYEMIQMCAYQLKELFDWVSVKENLDKALNRIKKMQKSKGYKYASYEKDEITEDITIKQLVMNIYKVFPRNSSNPDYRKALALALKSYKGKQQLTPLEVSQLRDIYDKHALDINRDKKAAASVNTDVKEKCELLLAERFKGKINQKHFAYTIIETLKRNNYTSCSPKQYAVIEEAYMIVTKANNNDNKVEDNTSAKTEVISDDDINESLASYNLSGGELFDDGDDE